MYVPEILHPLPNEGCIKEEEAFSPFTIYAVLEHKKEIYLLVPKQGQENLKDVIIIANEYGIRICHPKGRQKKLVYEVRQLLNCKDQNKFMKIEYRDIPTDIRSSIIYDLIKQIKYKAI